MSTGIRDPAASTYTFASQPRAVAPQRKKYRDNADGSVQMQPCNIMYDPRVVRGTTLTHTTAIGTTQQEDPVEVQRKREARRRKQAKERAAARLQKTEVDPVPGRQHIEVQTDVYLEELTDRVEEVDMAVQTDPFLDRAPDPVFIPAKTGVDAHTQIADGELFDFDLEARPVLEVLVGKTMEQAMMEVLEEEELDRLRDHQLKFEELRNAELIETQRLEEQARRRQGEKKRRLEQQEEVARREREAAKKIAARSFAQSYLSGLVPAVFRNLEEGGYFFDRQEREVETEFMPWLMDGVNAQLANVTRARALLDTIIRQAVAAQQSQVQAHATLAASDEEKEVPADESDAGEAAVPPATDGEGDGDGPSADDGEGEGADDSAAATAPPAADDTQEEDAADGRGGDENPDAEPHEGAANED